MLHPGTASFLRGIVDSYASHAFLYKGTYVKCLAVLDLSQRGMKILKFDNLIVWKWKK